jgi:hypothetical protein
LPEAFAEAVRVRAITATTYSWWEWFGRLQHHVEATGSAFVAGHADSLNLWIRAQRSAHRRGDLPADQFNALAALPGWAWNPHDEKWERKFEAVKQWLADGNTVGEKVQEDLTHNGVPIGRWIYKHKWLHANGNLSDERTRRLEGLPGWNWDVSRDVVKTDWDGYFRLFETYASERGTTQISREYETVEGYKLGVWINNQRRDGRTGKLSAARKQKLETIPNWTWTPREDPWFVMVDLLEQYINQTGETPQYEYCSPNGERLGSWCYGQRRAYSLQTLAPEKVERLEAIPGWSFSAPRKSPPKRSKVSRVERTPEEDAEWLETYETIRELATARGHLRINDQTELWAWLGDQLANRKLGSLSPKETGMIESLPGFAENLRDIAWEAHFLMLVRIVEKEHALPHERDRLQSGLNVGKWVNQQRAQRAKLTDERRTRLESIPGWTWNAREDRWTEWYDELRQESNKTGSSRIPASYVTPNGKTLGRWAEKQRMRYRKGLLTEDRKKLLEELSGWVWETR